MSQPFCCWELTRVVEAYWRVVAQGWTRLLSIAEGHVGLMRVGHVGDGQTRLAGLSIGGSLRNVEARTGHVGL